MTNKGLKFSCSNFKCFGFILILVAFLIGSCKNETTKKNDKLFQLLSSDETNIDFNNKLTYDSDFNIYTYRNFYNGGGVALGDINNDGLIDVFFTANMLSNRLYLNKGDFKFEDITEKAGITKKGAWSTGASMADVNGDGLIDIYVCNSGDIKGDKKQNELFINNGNLTFSEKAEEYGIADRGFSTHAAFLDYDKDGDLDMYLLNNSFKAIGSFNLRSNERNERDSLGGDKFFLNDNGKFKDISANAGIYGSIIGFGLGVTVGDVNDDGWQDIYVSNDFFERDYLYINNKSGGFDEVLENQMKSISAASMGADLADINNDKHPDIFVTEMLPEDEGRLKLNTSFENWYKYQFNLQNGYHHQFTRNMLQLNNGDDTFSEIGRMSGVYATDWSWGALIADFNNDGLKDIFVANGIYQDLTNQDYIRYVSNKRFVKSVVKGNDVDFKKLIDLIPSNPVPNYAYLNKGNLSFTNMAKEWGLADPSFSNGAAYGDLDNDGDLDLVVNNLNMQCFVYKNQSRQQHPENKYLRVKLVGEGKNTFALGTKVTLYYNNTLSYQEQMPIRGFESSTDHRLTFGVGQTKLIDSILVEWPNGKVTKRNNVQPNQELVLKEKESSPGKLSVDYSSIPVFTQTKEDLGIDFKHSENTFVDFDTERLLSQMNSTRGPALSKGDVNGDGLEDFYIGGAKGYAGGMFTQSASGDFRRTNNELLEKDKESEDVASLFFDADNDKDLDLYVCSGGNEHPDRSPFLFDRLYFNDGKGRFTKSDQLFPTEAAESSSCVSSADIDNDGDLDLFVGIRSKQFMYGQPVNGYILANNGNGVFSNITANVAPGLLGVGMITTGELVDIDNDDDPDLVIAGDYMALRVFVNMAGKLNETTKQAGLLESNGWWNKLCLVDINQDGYKDIIAGNHGLNSRFKASKNRPVTLYADDFDKNGNYEHIICRYNGAKSYPICLRDDIVSQMPSLKKKYYKYDSYKEQTISEMFTQAELNHALKLEAFEMATSVFINNKNGTFSKKALPVESQFSPIYGIIAKDFDQDGNVDLLMGGNLYQTKPEVGIYDANYALLLKGNGKGDFIALKSQESGIKIKGALRDIVEIKSKNKSYYLFALNNDKPIIYEIKKQFQLAGLKE